MPRFFIAAIATLAASAAFAEDTHHGHHDHAHHHEHGAADLTVAIQDQSVIVRLQLTGSDLFGPREHDDHHDDTHHGHGHGTEAAEGHGDEERGLEAAAALFEHPDDFVAFAASAGCALEATDVEMSEIEGGAHDGHKDFTVIWEYACTGPDALTGLTVTMLDRSTELEEVAVTVRSGGRAIIREAREGSTEVIWGSNGS